MAEKRRDPGEHTPRPRRATSEHALPEARSARTRPKRESGIAKRHEEHPGASEPIGVLLDVTQRLTEDAPLEECLQTVTDAALGLLDADHASIRVFDDTRKKLLSGARSGSGRTKKPVRFREGEGIIGWVTRTGQATRVDDVSEDIRFKDADQQGFAIRSMVAVPLWSAHQVIGVLSASRPEPNAFSPEQQQYAQLLANCVSPQVEKARLERLAITDHMTLTFNVRYLKPRLQEEMSRAQRNREPLSFLAVDLDRFKLVNDVYGHQAGDRVLRGFASTVRELVRRPDVMVRRGGDEFVLLMPSTEEHEAALVAARICDRMAETPIVLPDGREVRQTVSIGIATWNGEEPPESLESRADDALYRAKESGRNRIAIAERPSNSGHTHGGGSEPTRNRTVTSTRRTEAEDRVH